MAELFDSYVLALQKEFPKFKLVQKENSKLMKFLNFFIKLWNPAFMEQFTTVLGYSVYMPISVRDTLVGYEVLRHEAVHMRQFKKWWLLQTISYGILPIGPSFRAYWEYQGYLENIKVRSELGWPMGDAYIDWLVSQFTGRAYLWMWPFKASLTKKFKAERARLLTSSSPS
jgi:hypothetical protein